MSPIATPQPASNGDTPDPSRGHTGASNIHSAKHQLPTAAAFLKKSGIHRLKTPHYLDLSDSDAEGTRTPRPQTFTPSPPMSRTLSPNISDEDDVQQSSSANGDAVNADGQEEGNAVASGSNINGHLSKGMTRRKSIKRGGHEEESDLAVLMRTVDFAARHTCQRRKDLDQSPYINHPIAVANFLSSTGITDIRVLQSAILHDTVEDTHTTIESGYGELTLSEEIADHFGIEVARIVEECTDNAGLSAQGRKAEQIRTAPHKSKEAQQVKLADKLHNLESIRRAPPVGWGIRRVQAYFIWAKQVTDICAPSHPALGQRLQKLYETAYTEIDGNYVPCHPEICGPLLEEEKLRIDHRLHLLKKGEKPCPKPIFF